MTSDQKPDDFPVDPFALAAEDVRHHREALASSYQFFTSAILTIVGASALLFTVGQEVLDLRLRGLGLMVLASLGTIASCLGNYVLFEESWLFHIDNLVVEGTLKGWFEPPYCRQILTLRSDERPGGELGQTWGRLERRVRARRGPQFAFRVFYVLFGILSILVYLYAAYHYTGWIPTQPGFSSDWVAASLGMTLLILLSVLLAWSGLWKWPLRGPRALNQTHAKKDSRAPPTV